jgi:hypothetical protein
VVNGYIGTEFWYLPSDDLSYSFPHCRLNDLSSSLNEGGRCMDVLRSGPQVLDKWRQGAYRFTSRRLSSIDITPIPVNSIIALNERGFVIGTRRRQESCTLTSSRDSRSVVSIVCQFSTSGRNPCVGGLSVRTCILCCPRKRPEHDLYVR